ncbi:MAG: hypothetical protein N2203_04920 [Bacteroidia bacterium]|nr:hypothetical protein [Bacteroidia bacterium]
MGSRKDVILELLKENNEDVFLNYALGLELAAENDDSGAIQQFEKLLKINNHYIPAYYQCGLLYYKLNEKEKALELLNKGLAIAIDKKNNKDIAEFKSAITNIENDLL